MQGLNRRHFLYASAATAGLAVTRAAAQQQPGNGSQQQNAGDSAMESMNSLPKPGERKGKFLERDGARVFYQTFGEGEPILLLHGYPLSGALFARATDRLSKDHLVITVDHRGYGQSETQSEPDSVSVYADDALAVLDELKLDKATIGGMSMGGPIAFDMYTKAPERFSGLLLIDTIAAKANPAEAGLWNGVAEMVQQKGVSEIVPFLMPKMLTGKTRKEMKEQVNYLTAIMKECSKEAAIGGAKALAKRPDQKALLGKIEVPTLILVGMEDQVYPMEIAMMMQSAIKGSKLHVVPGAAHAAIFEKADDAAMAIVDWMGGGATGSIQK